MPFSWNPDELHARSSEFLAIHKTVLLKQLEPRHGTAAEIDLFGWFWKGLIEDYVNFVAGLTMPTELDGNDVAYVPRDGAYVTESERKQQAVYDLDVETKTAWDFILKPSTDCWNMNFRSLFVAGTAALLMLAPHEASAGWTEFTDWAASFWAYGKASAQGEVMPPEVFAAEAPAAIERAGTRGFVTTEAKNLGEGTEIFTMTVANYKDETTGRPVILWLDKIDGSETTRYADLGCDGYLDGVTTDGKPVLSAKIMKAVLTGNLDMAKAVLQQTSEEAKRYQPMFQADYSKALKLARERGGKSGLD